RVGEALGPYGSHRVMATTEAGLLPLYSEWTVLDTWGLNDPWIAHHHGLITADYLDRWKPDVIAIHGFPAPAGSSQKPNWQRLGSQPGWQAMLSVLEQYAEAHRYRTAATVGDWPSDPMIYYVRSDAPDAAKIIASIRLAVAQAENREASEP
ncbi:MAG TPA: hypothetical protein VMT64_11180, partial [Candidatus Binataceae bacterium]|nr:hypothetical protein [Candidatus Binataceae bacterium]